MERRKLRFHAVPSVVELYPGFHAQTHRNFANFPQVKDELNVSMAAICATVASETC